MHGVLKTAKENRLLAKVQGGYKRIDSYSLCLIIGFRMYITNALR